jgi:hypothetical protein
LLVVRVWLMLRLRRDERRGPSAGQSATIGDTMTGDNVTNETNEKHRIRAMTGVVYYAAMSLGGYIAEATTRSTG